MEPTMRLNLPSPQRKCVAATLRPARHTDRKPVAEDELKRTIGRAIERSLELARIEKKEAAALLGYDDQSALSRWISGAESAQVWRLWALGVLWRECFIVALSESAESPDIEVRTVVTLRRSAVSA